MFERNVKFNTIDQIKDFVTYISGIDADFDIIHNRYLIDAKSIMGIFSLDLSNVLVLRANTDDKNIEKNVDEMLKNIGAIRP